ncbi:MAG TPA: hypothetical protein PKJ19_08740 [Flavobacteriales bacterium]|nr:hypothetical protein [Flavobacteriales bacterium]
MAINDNVRIIPLTHAVIEQAAHPWPDRWEEQLGRLRWHLSTPYATALVAEIFGDVIGVGCGFVQGGVGRITVLGFLSEADAEVRVRLTDALIDALTAEGSTSIEVVAAPADVDRWQAFGFGTHETILRYTGGKFLQATRDEVIHHEVEHRLGILHLDRKAFGYDRSTLVMEHIYLCVVYMEGTRIRGFSLSLLGEGLIVADAPDVGLELQRWHFPIQEHILLPDGNGAHEHLTKQAYRHEVEGIRMVRGTVRPLQVELCFAWAWGAV